MLLAHCEEGTASSGPVKLADIVDDELGAIATGRRRDAVLAGLEADVDREPPVEPARFQRWVIMTAKDSRGRDISLRAVLEDLAVSNMITVVLAAAKDHERRTLRLTWIETLPPGEQPFRR